jgi:hypothetical protein
MADKTICSSGYRDSKGISRDRRRIEMARSGGLVLGRRTYEGLAGYWPSHSRN